MTQFQTIGATSDHVMATLVAGLDIEFGRGAGEALAARMLAAEECDFLWEMRQAERWLGPYESTGWDEIELDRLAIIGRLDGRWFVAVSIIDGDGQVHGLIARRGFEREDEARAAYNAMR